MTASSAKCRIRRAVPRPIQACNASGSAARELAQSGQHALQNALTIVFARFSASDLDDHARRLVQGEPANAGGRAKSATKTAKNEASAATTSGFGLHLHPSG